MPLQFLTEIQSFWQSGKLPAILAGLSIFSIGISAVLLIKSTQSSSPIQFFDNVSGSHDVLGDSRVASYSAKSKNMVHVDIEGGVRAPGLYELPGASRLDDAIAKAGGFSEEADMEFVSQKLNRASMLTDGMKIYVPKNSETSHNVQSNETSQNGSLVNINSASEEELDALSGVGPVTAKKIIDNRPYGSLEDLVSKKAVGNALFEKIKEKLTL